MTEKRGRVLLVCSGERRREYVSVEDLARLESFADFDYLDPDEDRARVRERLKERAAEVDAIVIHRRRPRIDAEIMDAAPRLRFIGELEGDRFAEGMDVEEAWRRGICAVDTTNGSSYPVSEWALGLILVCLRNAGAHFREIVAGNWKKSYDGQAYLRGELTGRRVGLIGCGHVGRRLLKLLAPFETENWVYDPYLPVEMADALGFVQTSLDNVLSQCGIVVCLLPLTPKTEGMLGRRELNLLAPGSVFVNPTRGQVVDSAALLERLRRGDIVTGLDVFEPEPIPAEQEILQLDNVFLSPHIAGVTLASRSRFFALMVDELDRFYHGHHTRFDLTVRSLANRRGVDIGEEGHVTPLPEPNHAVG